MNSTKKITLTFLLAACLLVTPLAGCHKAKTGKSGSSASVGTQALVDAAAEDASDHTRYSSNADTASADSQAGAPGSSAANPTGGTAANPATGAAGTGTAGVTGTTGNTGTTGTTGTAGTGGTKTNGDTGNGGNKGTTTTKPDPAPAPTHSQYYVAPPSSSGYNSGLTDMYNSHFLQGSAYNGSETSQFHAILMKYATGKINDTEAQNELSTLTWTENGHPSTVQDTGTCSKTVVGDNNTANDAQVIYNDYNPVYKTVIHPSGNYWVGNAIVYNAAPRLNTIYTLYCNIKQY